MFYSVNCLLVELLHLEFIFIGLRGFFIFILGVHFIVWIPNQEMSALSLWFVSFYLLWWLLRPEDLNFIEMKYINFICFYQ